MTRAEALRIVLRNALKFAAGAGTGLRAVASSSSKAELVRAAERLWPDAYGRDLQASDLYSYGLHLPKDPDHV